jgi:hypothetical protein
VTTSPSDAPMAAGPPAPSLVDQIAELRRELALRQRVYPQWIAKGSMKQEAADRSMARMQAAHDTLVRLLLGHGG